MAFAHAIYADAFWAKRKKSPSEVTAININAPTQHQFDCIGTASRVATSSNCSMEHAGGSLRLPAA
eukprot:6173094-Pleurochrysis_carterae.AAC.1